MERLSFSKSGQWTLIKDEPRPNTEYRGQKDTDFMSYRTRALEGRLPEDHGQRGKVHNVGNVRAPRKISEHRMKGKVPTPITSGQEDRNPSRSGLDT